MNGTVSNVQGISSYIDYTTNKSIGNEAVANVSVLEVVAPVEFEPSLVNKTYTTTNVTESTISQPSTTISAPIVYNDTQMIPTVVDNGWVDPFP